jgi:glycosyltransferase involved in cell wall biosynthesis
MRIAIDISQIVYGTGVSVYTKNLVENLLKIDLNNEYKLFGGSFRRRGELTEYLNGLKNYNFKSNTFPVAPFIADLFFNRVRIVSIERLIGKADVFHSSDWTQPPSSAFNVTTIHDLVPILFPEWSDPKITDVHKRRLELVKKEVDVVIVPSHATKKDLMRMGFTADKIKVIPEAVDPAIKKSSKKRIKELRKKYNLNKSFLLSVGITPRKNTQRIIDAFNRLSIDGLDLVLIGHPHMPINTKKNIKVLGHINQEDIAPFYTAAEALVYPSLYEGFGLPILEAFTCGTPVVTSHTGSMKEVAGSAAVLVDPISTESIADGIRTALERPDTYIQKGVKKAREYSWKKCAVETLEVYNKVHDSTL